MSILVLLAACAPDPGPSEAAVGPDLATVTASIPASPHRFDRELGIDTVVERTPADVVRFVALGDAGEGNSTQYTVGDAMTAICATRGCDFAVYLGDNFYNDGIDDRYDPQWDEKFELPYADLDIPFYVTLGNHDYGGNGSGYEFWKAPYYVDYTDVSDKWTFPATYYRVTGGVVDLWSLDTNAAVWGFFDDQTAWLDRTIPLSTAPWTVAFGHHPYRSNGPHGNAGSYDGASASSAIGSGAYMKRLVESSLCGKVDVYLCGHDHSKQWLQDSCDGTELIVSGAGSKTTGLDDHEPVAFQEDDAGFLWVEVDATHFTGVFYDQTGRAQFERTITK